MVKRLGADYVFDYGKADWPARVPGVTRSQGVQAYLDSVGDLASDAFGLLSQLGDGSSTEFAEPSPTVYQPRCFGRWSEKAFL